MKAWGALGVALVVLYVLGHGNGWVLLGGLLMVVTDE